MICCEGAGDDLGCLLTCNQMEHGSTIGNNNSTRGSNLNKIVSRMSVTITTSYKTKANVTLKMRKSKTKSLISR